MKLSIKVCIICLIFCLTISSLIKVSNTCNVYANNKPVPRFIKSETILYSKCSIVSVLPTPDELNRNKIIYDDSMIPNDNLPNFVEPNRPEEIDIISYIINLYGEETVEALTSLLWGESRGIPSKSHKAGTIWVVLNRYDTGNFGNSILEVVTAKNQFCGYKKNRVYSDINLYNECKDLVIDVLYRYTLEKNGDANVGRTLPASYLYFIGNGEENLYTEKWKSKKYWDWSLPNPYDKDNT